METIIEKTMLYDFYSSLLTEKQRLFFTLYHFEDFSLNEISKCYGVTPQAVRDLVKRTENLLYVYESKLKLFDIYISQTKNVNSFLNFVDNSLEMSMETKSLIKDKIKELL